MIKDQYGNVYDSVIFKNYTKTGSLKFTNYHNDGVHKTLECGYKAAFSFPSTDLRDTVKYKINGGEEQTASLNNGSFDFQLNPDEYIEFLDLPPSTSYKITNTSLPDGWYINSSTNLEGTITVGEESEARTNLKYNYSFQIQVKVHLEGEQLKTGQFSFQIYDFSWCYLAFATNGEPDTQEYISEGVPNPNYNTAIISFDDLPKTAYYNVVQVNTSLTDIYDYDKTWCQVDVNETYDENGVPKCEVIYLYDKNPSKTYFNNKVKKGSLEFVSNVDNATDYSKSIGLEYKLNLFNADGVALTGSFPFTIIDDNVDSLETNKVSESFSEISNDDIFSLKDGQKIVIENLPAGTQYNIESASDLSGFSVKKYDDEPVDSKSFSSGSIIGDTLSKGSCLQSYFASGNLTIKPNVELHGGFLENNMFEYYLKDISSAPFALTKNKADGSINLNAGDFLMDSIGKTFEYEITQDNSNPLPNVSYDSNKYTISITPQDNGDGTIGFLCKYFKNGTEMSDPPTFVNEFKILEMPFTGVCTIAIIIAVGTMAFVIYMYLKRKRNII